MNARSKIKPKKHFMVSVKTKLCIWHPKFWWVIILGRFLYWCFSKKKSADGLKIHFSSHLANIRMILQVRMNTLIDQQQLELFLKQYPGNDFFINYDKIEYFMRYKSSMKRFFELNEKLFHFYQFDRWTRCIMDLRYQFWMGMFTMSFRHMVWLWLVGRLRMKFTFVICLLRTGRFFMIEDYGI